MRASDHRLGGLNPSLLLAAALVCACLATTAEAARRQYTMDNDPLRLGDRALAESRLDEAVTHFEEAVANDHHLPDAYFGLAQVAERRARYADAADYCRQALAAAGGNHPPARATLGLQLLREGQTDAARSELTRALDEDPKLWAAHYGLARLLLADGDLDGARGHLDQGRSLRGLDAGEDRYRYGEALVLEAGGDLEGAERSALQAVTLNPVDPEYAALLARLYTARGYDALAINVYEQMLANSGDTAPATVHHALGRLYAGQRRFNDASNAYLQAAAADSTYAPALLDLADLFRLAKRWDRAAGTYLRYLDLNPDDAVAERALAETMFELGRYDEAANAARSAGDLDPADPLAPLLFVRAGLRAQDPDLVTAAMAQLATLPADTPWQADDLLELATHQEAAGDTDAALASLARAAELAPEQVQVPYRQGMLALRAGRPAEAVEPFTRAAALAPTVPVYPMNLGIAHYQLGDPEAAAADFARAVAIDGNLTAARLLLAQALTADGRLAEAEAEYVRVQDQEPDNAKALRGLGYCRLRRADYAGAATAYTAATRAETENADGWAGLGSARLGQGDLDGAARAFDRARSIDPDNPLLKAGSELLNKAANAGKETQPK